MIFLGVLFLVVTLLFVVGIHEAGHALAAKFFNIKIERISFGFGKPLLKWQGKNNIEWVWAR